MKKILLIALFSGAINLFAQVQSDSLLIKEIVSFQKTIEKQEQVIDGLTSHLNRQQLIINQQQYFFDSLSSRVKSLNTEMRKQQSIINLQRNSIGDLSDKAMILENKADSLTSLIKANRSNIASIADDLGIKIKETGQQAETRISELGGDIEKNRLYWIIATLVTLLLGALMYLLLGKRIRSSKTDVETQIRNTKKSLEEESLKLDGELIKVFQKQLEVLENSPKGSLQDEDHSLVLKIADRLTAMETNLYRMDPNTRGLNNLKNLVKSTKENFNAKEYEIVEMLGMEYKEGMEVIATFIPSDEIEIGKQIITKIVKPQVNFKGQTIQAAQIEVSIGE